MTWALLSTSAKRYQSNELAFLPIAELAHPSRYECGTTLLVDGNQLCDLGHATQIVLFYRCLVAMAQSKQRLYSRRFLTV
jgi:hypothetical protein